MRRVRRDLADGSSRDEMRRRRVFGTSPSSSRTGRAMECGGAASPGPLRARGRVARWDAAPPRLRDLRVARGRGARWNAAPPRSRNLSELADGSRRRRRGVVVVVFARARRRPADRRPRAASSSSRKTRAPRTTRRMARTRCWSTRRTRPAPFVRSRRSRTTLRGGPRSRRAASRRSSSTRSGPHPKRRSRCSARGSPDSRTGTTRCTGRVLKTRSSTLRTDAARDAARRDPRRRRVGC